jgi:Sulfotransferase family
MPGSLPEFVIIGATKAATTWLLQNLQAHPRVWMPDAELHYFSRHPERGEAWYRAQFAGAPPGRVIGEKSASYLPHPAAPIQLRALLPEARLVAQLRNPIERAYSDYCMHYRRGQVGRRLGRYLDPAGTPIPRLLQDGLYFRHLSAWLAVFPRAQIEVVLYDDIRRAPAAVFGKVCGHLGIEQPAASALLDQRIKNKNAVMLPPLARRVLAPLKGAVAPWRENAAFRFARALIARRIDYPALTPALRDQLADYYREDVAALGRLLGRDLGGWLVERQPDASGRSAA